MLPAAATAAVGELLARQFGLAQWQIATTASDANRFLLRWARAATGRSVVLVFDGCYHGAVDDTLVELANGHTQALPGQVGRVIDVTRTTRVVAFNDVEALRDALAPGDVAAVLCEPALTNCGMVLPDPGFHTALRDLTHQYGTLLLIDETHTLSAGPQGYTGAFGLAPDAMVIGKAIAGGVPCAVYGVTTPTSAVLTSPATSTISSRAMSRSASKRLSFESSSICSCASTSMKAMGTTALGHAKPRTGGRADGGRPLRNWPE